MIKIRWSIVSACLWLTAAGVWATDNLDSLKGKGWSPNSQWLAFNLPNQDTLFVIHMNGRRIFQIRPLGQVVLDTSNLFAGGASTNAHAGAANGGMNDGVTMTIGSPGHLRLEALDWSPNSEYLAYSFEKKMRATFSVPDRTVKDTFSTNDVLPWYKPEDWRLMFEFERPTTNHPAQYAMRVVRPDNSVVKEILFQDPREVQRISLLRNSDSSFLTPDRQRLIYPKRQEGGWQLMIENVTGNAGSQPLTSVASGAPYEWKLDKNGKRLAVVENGESLAVGPLDDWTKADRVSFSNLTLNVAWSPDGRFLACHERQQLFLLETSPDTGKIMGELQRVTDHCHSQFWGWRGTRLIFGDAQRSADLYALDTAKGRTVELMARGRNWESSPAIRTVSPDGQSYICLVPEIDGEGRFGQELWRIALEPGAEWDLLNKFRPSDQR